MSMRLKKGTYFQHREYKNVFKVIEITGENEDKISAVDSKGRKTNFEKTNIEKQCNLLDKEDKAHNEIIKNFKIREKETKDNDDYVERIRTELYDLEVRTGALEQFTRIGKFETLSKQHQKLLKDQEKAMKQYLKVLRKRFELLGGK